MVGMCSIAAANISCTRRTVPAVEPGALLRCLHGFIQIYTSFLPCAYRLKAGQLEVSCVLLLLLLPRSKALVATIPIG